MAANSVGADVILRVTSDCPLIDPEVCGEVLRRFMAEKPDYASNCAPQSWPHGYDCEVYSRELLDRADKQPVRDVDHGGSAYMESAPGISRVSVVKPGEDMHHIRLTIDRIDDYVAIWREFIARQS
jgi:spore coat polysaccharide biosynthesis protein SpsF (cytidylyltransferase family)